MKKTKKLLSIFLSFSVLISGLFITFGVDSVALDAKDQIALQCSQESMVLLENNNNSLPVRGTNKVALFGGVGATKTAKSGTGSADTNGTVISVWQGLKDEGFTLSTEQWLSNFSSRYDRAYNSWFQANGASEGLIAWNHFFIEDPLLSDSDISTAKNGTDTCIYVIRRISGEGTDRARNFDPNRYSYQYDSGLLSGYGCGEFTLSPNETANLTKLGENFGNVIVLLNTCGPIDTSFFSQINGLDSMLYIGLNGRFTGTAAAQIIKGSVNPSGKLTYTWAKSYEDYPSSATFDNYANVQYTEDIYNGYRYFETFAPDRVAYGFGHGLSYTDFSLTERTVSNDSTYIYSSVKVTNKGSMAGKLAVGFYYGAPQGKLGKPVAALAEYAKTEMLSPGQSQILSVKFEIADMASYDDMGKTGYKSCYVLEEGEYSIYIGESVRSALRGKAGSYIQPKTAVTRALTQYLTPTNLEKRLYNDGSNTVKYEPLNNSTDFSLQGMVDYPTKTNTTGRKLMLKDVMADETLLDDFIGQFNRVQLYTMVEGHTSAYNVDYYRSIGYDFYGIPDKDFYSGAIGGIEEYGVYAIRTADGMSGLKNKSTYSVSAGNMVSCTWNRVLVYTVADFIASEYEYYNADISLASPAMNTIRDPLNGRDFEYLSEDPIITGTLAVEYIKGFHNHNITTTVKHFAFNNKENNRTISDSVLSERAAREIYLKGYEIAIKKGRPDAVMTSYNRMNGVETETRCDLISGILKGEWGFDGMVMSDWGNEDSHAALSIRAGTDVKMCYGNHDEIAHGLATNTISEGQLQHAAANAVKLIMHSRGYYRNNPTTVAHTTTKNISSSDSTRLYGRFANITSNNNGVETCYDTDGGFNITDFNNGCTIYYNIFVEKSGTYNIKARTACPVDSGGQYISYIFDKNQVTNSPAIPVTGGWQNWATGNSVSIELKQGYHSFAVKANGINYNLNWLEISPVSLSKTVKGAETFLVDYDDAFEKGLPSSAEIKLDDGSSSTVGVVWNGFNKESLKSQNVFKGSLKLSSDIENPSDYIPVALIDRSYITGVSILNTETSLYYGDILQMKAKVSGTKLDSDNIIWSVSGYSGIDKNGLLRVGMDGIGNSTLIVTATSVENPDYSDSVTLNITRNAINIEPSGTNTVKGTYAHSAGYNYKFETCFDTSYPGYNVTDFNGDNGATLNFTTDIKLAGAYNVSIRYAMVADADPSRYIELQLDGKTLCNFTEMNNTGGWQNWTGSNEHSVFLPSGVHTLKLIAHGNNYNFNCLNITADYILADPTGDATVNALDALRTLQFSIGKIDRFSAERHHSGGTSQNPSDEQIKLADTDDDRKITSNDSLLILQHAVEIITHFPVETN